MNSDSGTIPAPVRAAESGRAGGAGAAFVQDDLVVLPDVPPAVPALGFDRIAATVAAMVEAGSIAVGLYGPSGSGRSTLLQAIRSALPVDRYARVSIDPAAIPAADNVYVHLRDRAMERLTARFLGIRSRRMLRVLLWISDHPWLYGLAALLVLTALALVVDPSLSWQMLDDVYHAWRTAKAGEEVRAVRYIMEWYPVGLILHVAPWVAAGLPLAVRLAPLLLRLASSRAAIAKASASDPQALCRDLAAMAISVRRKLVFLIDNLDRCTPERTAELVEAVRCLAGAGCIVFVACDDRRVAAALAAVHQIRTLDRTDGGDLLAEAVQLPLRLPALGREEAGALLFRRQSRDAADASSTSAIVEETVGPFIEPLGLSLRFLKTCTRTIKLQLGIGGFTSEAEVRRLAAAVLADMADPAWLDAHASGLPASADSVLARRADLADRLRQDIGTDEAALRQIYRRLGRRPCPPGKPQVAVPRPAA